jgi:hypothetical protein
MPYHAGTLARVGLVVAVVGIIGVGLFVTSSKAPLSSTSDSQGDTVTPTTVITSTSTQPNSTAVIALSAADGATVCPEELSGQGAATWDAATHTCTLNVTANVGPTLCVSARTGGCVTVSEAKLVIGPGVTLEAVNGSSLAVYSELDNYGTINASSGGPIFTVYGQVDNYGTIVTTSLVVIGAGGHGTIENYPNGTIVNEGQLTSDGLIVNNGTIDNEGTINECLDSNSAQVCGNLENTGTMRCLDSCTVQTRTVYSSLGVVSKSDVSSSGLQLRVGMNSSTLELGGTAFIQVEVWNTLGHNVSVAVGPNQNISAWNSDDFVCAQNPSYSLVGFAIFQGHETSVNISSAGTPLQIAAPAALPCAYRMTPDNASFLGNSDEAIASASYGGTQETTYPVTALANATTSYCSNSSSGDGSGTVACPSLSGVVGYWKQGFGYTGDMSLGSSDFTYLPPGQYTVVATDAWNQYVYAYFNVV